MMDRILRAIRLDPSLYREVGGDERLNGEATLVVLGATLLSAIGLGFASRQWALTFGAELINGLLLGWLLWAVIANLIGDFLGGRSQLGSMIRALGYANAPRFVAVLSFVPCVGWLFRLAAWALTIAAGVIAIRETMEFDTFKAIVTAVVGLAVYVLFNIFIGLFFGGLGAAGSLFR
jgi:Yip1 domain